MKVAYVVPRYGVDVVGGAELGARLLAEHLAAAGCRVEAYTTCALDARTWADEYREGSVEVNGVIVNRFRSAAGRDPGFDAFSRRVLADPASASPSTARRWIELQGPVCPAALDAAAEAGADVVVFYPYLYWPTVHGVSRLGSRSVLHPATHDEAPIRLPVFREVFGTAGGLVFQTAGERRLTERLFPAVSASPQAVVGLGVEPEAGEEAEARASLGLGERPYLLCLGRVDAGKGSPLLAEWFAAYKRRRPGPLKLVLAGPVHDRVVEHPDIVVAGIIDERTKWGALRGTEVLVSPSWYESFSLVLLEGWLAGRAALVNGACAATREHCEASGAGLWFWSYAGFEGALDRLLGDRGLRDRLGSRGRAYVERRYTWPRLMLRYQRFLRRVASSASGQNVAP